MRKWKFQCSSASRKFLNLAAYIEDYVARLVSVLFSEPKISQWCCDNSARVGRGGFSALQRAENFSIRRKRRRLHARSAFQCSSASRKFLNCAGRAAGARCPTFQCSSASRKFLNRLRCDRRCKRLDVSVLFSEPKISQFWQNDFGVWIADCFSALQRAENFSIVVVVRARGWVGCVSVLFSEPKISQS